MLIDQPYCYDSEIITILSKEIGKLVFLRKDYEKVHQKISI